jgi:hypothetical protein
MWQNGNIRAAGRVRENRYFGGHYLGPVQKTDKGGPL